MSWDSQIVSHDPDGSIRNIAERRDGAVPELLDDPETDPPELDGGGIAAAIDVVSPPEAAASSPREIAAANTLPSRAATTARNSVISVSSIAYGRSAASMR